MTHERAGAARHPTFAYVGCFTHGTPTHHEYAHGKGISVYRIDRQTGAWALVQICEAAPNPGFLVLDHSQKFLYAGHGSASEVSSYSIEQQTGNLTPLNRQETSGHNSVHLNMDPANRYVVVANGPGVAVFPINGDGSLAASSDRVVPAGEPGRQKQMQKAHPHHIVFDPSGRFLVAPDHGIDRIHVYQLDPSSGKLAASSVPPVKSRSGAAPRHIAFHPTRPFAYIVNELDCTVTAYRWNGDRGALTPIQVLPRTPPTYTGDDRGSEIAVAPSGNFVYASNRGHDSIVIFSVEDTTGMLNNVGWEPTQGKKPRFFGLDRSGDLLYAANVETDTIVIFRVDNETGKLTPTGQIVETASPTCIVFAYF